MKKTFIIAIAKIVDDNSNMIGFRLLNTDGKNGQIKDTPLAAIVNALRNNLLEIDNLGAVSGELVGTQGSIDRLPEVRLNGELAGNKNSALTILTKLDDVGYAVTNYKGQIKNMRTDECVGYSKQYGISNGKIVTKDGLDYVSAINGAYRVGSIPKVTNAKIKARDVIDNSDQHITRTLTREKNLGGIAKSMGVAVDEEVEFNDTFNLLNNEQRTLIQNYYVWWSVKTFESLAGSKKLELTPKKALELARIKGKLDWSYAGSKLAKLYNECGYDYCSLGHKLYKVHFAKGVDDMGNEEKIKFGSTCVADFFDISPEGVRKLDKVTTAMAAEIAYIIEAVKDNRIEDEWQNVKLMSDIVDVLVKNNKCEDVFGDRLGYYLVAFKKADIPYTESLLKMSMEYANKKLTTIDFWKLIFTTTRQLNALDRLSANNHKMITDSSGFRNRNIDSVLERTLDHYFRVKLEGKYAYDPINKVGDRGKGKFTKEAVSTRKYFNSSVKNRLGIEKFTMQELTTVMNMYGYLLELKDSISMSLDAKISTDEYKEYISQSYSTKQLKISGYNNLLDSKSRTDYYRLSNSCTNDSDKALWYTLDTLLRVLNMSISTYGDTWKKLLVKVPGEEHSHSIDISCRVYETLEKTGACNRLADIQYTKFIEEDLNKFRADKNREEQEKIEKEAKQQKEDEQEKALAEERSRKIQQLNAELDRKNEEARLQEQIDKDKEKQRDENKKRREEERYNKSSEDLALQDMKITDALEKYDKSNGVICTNEKCKYNDDASCKILMALGNKGDYVSIDDNNSVCRCFITDDITKAYNKVTDGLLGNVNVSLDSLQKLRILINNGIYDVGIETSIRTYIAKDIVGRSSYVSNESLSTKQSYIITDELNRLEKELAHKKIKYDYIAKCYMEEDTLSEIKDIKKYLTDKKSNEQVKNHVMGDISDGENLNYDLKDHKDIKDSINKVLTAVDNNGVDLNSKTVSIIKTVLNRGRFSDKQYKYIKEAIDTLS